MVLNETVGNEESGCGPPRYGAVDLGDRYERIVLLNPGATGMVFAVIRKRQADATGYQKYRPDYENRSYHSQLLAITKRGMAG